MNAIKTIGIIVLTTGLSACAGMSNTERGTLVGAGTGAVAGAVITGGHPVGIIGGAAVGGIIGHEVGERQDERGNYYR
jgi:osmotically inducible lipoprotein OsmB